MLQQALNNEFFQRKIDRQCITIITQARVEADDPAFQQPTKPIGGFMTEEQARLFEKDGWQVVEDAGRGWRRVVASPEPVEIIEEKAIAQAVELGWIVVAVGGGGIPVVRNAKGELRSMYAVIDKDRASSLLASSIDADLFLISTGVERVAINFGKPNQIESGSGDRGRGQAVPGRRALRPWQHEAQDRSLHPLSGAQHQAGRRCPHHRPTQPGPRLARGDWHKDRARLSEPRPGSTLPTNPSCLPVHNNPQEGTKPRRGRLSFSSCLPAFAPSCGCFLQTPPHLLTRISSP